MKIAVCPCVPTVNLNHHMVDKNENVRTFFFLLKLKLKRWVTSLRGIQWYIKNYGNKKYMQETFFFFNIFEIH